MVSLGNMSKIKKYCVSCGDEIPGTKEYYEQHGNYCLLCSGVALNHSLMSNEKREERGQNIKYKLLNNKIEE